MLFIIKTTNLNDLNQVLRFAEKDDDTILLIQDAVFLVYNEQNSFIKKVRERKIQLKILKNDLHIRGIDNKAQAETITYKDMVDLIEQHTVFS